MAIAQYSNVSSEFRLEAFSMRHTFESAQPLTFYAEYDQKANSLLYGSGKLFMHLESEEYGSEAVLKVYGTNSKAYSSEAHKRFRLDDDMKKIYKKIAKDTHVSEAITRYYGMRLTLNDPWETTLCFIISQFNNVKRIRLIVSNIVERFGDVVYSDGKLTIKSFPTSEKLKNATDSELRALGTGFRSKYITSAAAFCTDNMDLYKLSPNNYDKLKSRLMEIDGVGDKVADCIALMGYGNLRAFPTDVWIKRTMEKLYFDGKKVKTMDIHEFAKDYWGPYAGYAQQYLFHNARTYKPEKQKVEKITKTVRQHA
ncbi:MAG: DNA glycosylase [Methanothrix sp.]